VTLNPFGLGKAIYLGTQSHPHFYDDLVAWLTQAAGLQSLLKVPENIEVSLREKDGARVYFLINHQNQSVRIPFYKPMRNFLTGSNLVGNYEMPPNGILVVEEHPETGG